MKNKKNETDTEDTMIDEDEIQKTPKKKKRGRKKKEQNEKQLEDLDNITINPPIPKPTNEEQKQEEIPEIKPNPDVLTEMLQEEKKPEQKPKTGLRSKVDELDRRIEDIENKKLKKFKLPSLIRAKGKNAAKKNQVLVSLLRTNHTATYEFSFVNDGMVFVQGVWRKIDPSYIFMLNSKIPMIVLPEWSFIPIGPVTFGEDKEKKAIAENQAFILRAIEQAKVEQKGFELSNFNWKAVLVIVGIAGVVIYVMFGGQLA